MHKMSLKKKIQELRNGIAKYEKNKGAESNVVKVVRTWKSKNEAFLKRVEKITVPGYLYKRELAIVKSASQITLLGNALWGEDLDTGLTNRLIGFLQKKFNQPDVYAYPWGIEKTPNVKISVQITRFIAQGNHVYLDATWSLENIKTKRREARLFSTKVVATSNVESIVKAMDSAFSKFEQTVARGIRVF